MSNALSPRSVDSTTVGTSEARTRIPGSSLSPVGCHSTVAHDSRSLELGATRRLRMLQGERSLDGIVRREVILPASRQEAWAALTRSEELSAWFEADVEIDPHPRGTLAIRFPDGTTRTGAVLAADPPYRLVLVWEEARDAGGLEAQASRVE